MENKNEYELEFIKMINKIEELKYFESSKEGSLITEKEKTISSARLSIFDELLLEMYNKVININYKNLKY